MDEGILDSADEGVGIAIRRYPIFKVVNQLSSVNALSRYGGK